MEKPVLLVVEDNTVNQMVVRALTERYGYEMIAVKSGREALELLEKQERRFSAILMDVNMPIMNGIECTMAIRELEAEQEWRTPIIGLSAHTSESCRRQCLVAGMDDYLSKPFDPNVFRNTLSQWIPRSEMQHLRDFQSSENGRESA
jgi:CheY-like chemotaxis protein